MHAHAGVVPFQVAFFHAADDSILLVSRSFSTSPKDFTVSIHWYLASHLSVWFNRPLDELFVSMMSASVISSSHLPTSTSFSLLPSSFPAPPFELPLLLRLRLRLFLVSTLAFHSTTGSSFSWRVYSRTSNERYIRIINRKKVGRSDSIDVYLRVWPGTALITGNCWSATYQVSPTYPPYEFQSKLVS